MCWRLRFFFFIPGAAAPRRHRFRGIAMRVHDRGSIRQRRDANSDRESVFATSRNRLKRDRRNAIDKTDDGQRGNNNNNKIV